MVDKVNFSLEKGELVDYDPNGAGKTTLMKTITGMVKPRGNIYLNGHLKKEADPRRVNLGLSLAQQIVSPLNSFTCLDNVALACGKKKPKILNPFYKESRKEKKAKELLEIVGLGEFFKNSYNLPLGYLKGLEMAGLWL